jgi:hypothetical protein
MHDELFDQDEGLLEEGVEEDDVDGIQIGEDIVDQVREPTSNVKGSSVFNDKNLMRKYKQMEKKDKKFREDKLKDDPKRKMLIA